MKKAISIVLVLMLMISLCSSAFAISADDGYVTPEEFFAPTTLPTHEEIIATIYDDPNTITRNEYDSILESKAAAEITLTNRRSTLDERIDAQETLAFDPTEKVYEYQNKTDEELIVLGLNEERISIIRDFQGTEEEMRALAASVYINSIPRYTVNAGGRWSKVSMTFAWDSAPFWNYTDGMLAGATGNNLVERVDDTKAAVQYIPLLYPNGTNSQINLSKTAMEINPFSGHLIQGFSFPTYMDKIDYNTWQSYSVYAASGSATFVFKSLDAQSVGLSYGYAHAKRSVTGSLSFSSGGLGFSFGLTPNYYDVTSAAHDTYYF